MGRTGKLWAGDHSGVAPDISASAPRASLPACRFSAIVSRAEIMDWPPGSHASTFGGNPVAIAAALATIDLLEQKVHRPMPRAWAIFLMQRPKQWPDRHPLVGDVRGKGLMIGIELVKDRVSKQFAVDERNELPQPLSFEKGLLVLGCGASTIRLMPPLVIDREQATIALDILEQCLTEIEKEGAVTLPRMPTES